MKPATKDMTRYVGTKLLLATAMTREVYNAYRGWDLPEDENGAEAGYLVEYLDGGESNHPDHDGYISWTPSEVFHRAYRPVHQMTFGDALLLLKAGVRVQRAGWNGKGMFIYMVPAAEYPAQRGAAKRWAGEGAMIPYGAYLAMKTVDGTVVPWLASQTDILAEDWAALSDDVALIGGSN